MPLAFVCFQYLPYSAEQRGVYSFKPLAYILVDRAFADPELFGGSAHGGVVLDQILSQRHGALLNDSFHPDTSRMFFKYI